MSIFIKWGSCYLCADQTLYRGATRQVSISLLSDCPFCSYQLSEAEWNSSSCRDRAVIRSRNRLIPLRGLVFTGEERIHGSVKSCTPFLLHNETVLVSIPTGGVFSRI